MKNQLIKSPGLQAGDKVATVSLSWGGAGDDKLLWRYEQGKLRLEQQFGLRVVEMPNTLKGTQYVYSHPEKRAEDLMLAFQDDSIKGIFSCIGGDESVRLLPHIDFDVIRTHPKVFLGYSDTTVAHMMCLKAGISSFYGPSILAEFAENIAMHDYTVKWINAALFNKQPIGAIEPSEVWTSERLAWLEENKHSARTLHPNPGGYELLQGTGVAEGRLIGGCIEVLEMIKGTPLWPTDDMWQGSLLFLETSEEKPTPAMVERWLRNYGSQGILHRINGILWGKPYDNLYYEEYKKIIRKVVAGELGLSNLPILYNMNFGHTAPMTVLPYGALAQIDCERKQFRILESGVE
jgi:muramoyltetrapeptide carboxypeptidase LdcA involved in peptidoglycan recycling